jgi:predicted Zn-ribbon and HTH transcriptional regulator
VGVAGARRSATTGGSRPPAATETPRQAIHRLLSAKPHSTYELSALVGVREKDVVPHLQHLARSLRRSGERLVVEPARCRDCGYAFRERQRLGRPSSCPRCHGQHLSVPMFRIERAA